MRKRLFEIIEVADDDKVSTLYDGFMLISIIVSIIPLCTKSQTLAFWYIDKITVAIFILDYLFRWITADYKVSGHGTRSFLIYPFTPMAIVDLLSILPSVTVLNGGFRLLKLFRVFKTLRVLKFVRYSKNLRIVINVLKREKDILLAVGYIAIGYILVAGLVMFQAEPDSFDTLFDAVYWSTTALTTVGYGDVYPVTVFGRVVSMVSSVVGIAVVALPAGVITGGFIDELRETRSSKK